jgi:parallel beta-helix repeat protein
MLRKLSVVLVTAGALALGACSSSSTPTTNLCSNVTAPCTAITAGMTEAQIDAAVAAATTGTTIVFDTGNFKFANTLSIPAVSNLTITGQGANNTSLDFGSQTAGTAGIAAINGNSKITFSNFSVLNTPGDGIKVQGGNGVIFSKVNVSWSNASPITHGAYGIYPVQSQAVSITGCDVSGARDTGVYVGQSFNIIVSGNTVHDNVAGIEIESSINADVHDNVATNNSGGILVFALPGLLPPPGSGVETDGTANVRVYNNQITANNTANFGDPSGTVAAIPGGTGLVVLASVNVEVFGNTITNNHSVGYAVVCYFLINPTFDPTDTTQNPTGMNPFAGNVYAHDNTFSGNGAAPIAQNQSPDGGVSTNQLGELLAGLVLVGAFPGGSVPDMVWDGIANEGPPTNYVPPTAPTNATSVGSPANPVDYFIESNGSATFANLNFPVLVPGGNPADLNQTAITFYATPFTVASPPAGFPLPGVDAGVIP